MSEPLKIGDWVVVAYDACCANPREALGKVFQIDRFIDFSNNPCASCGEIVPFVNAVPASGTFGYTSNRLKRLPPLAELEGEKRDEKLTEPA